MGKAFLIVLFLFVLSVLAFERQFYDAETVCLDSEEGCADDGHVFKDSEIFDDDVGYPNYPSPDTDENYQYSEGDDDEILISYPSDYSHYCVPSEI